MVYEWEKHREEIYQLYIVENWDLKKVMAHLDSKYGFSPQKRAYQEQIRKWNYLKSQNHVKPAAPPDRLRALWEQNLSWREITQQLQQEGFRVTEQEIIKQGNANGLSIRQGTRARSKSSQSGTSQPSPLDYLDGDFSGDESMLPPSTSSTSSLECFHAKSTEPGHAERRTRIKVHASKAFRRRKPEMTLTAAKSMLGINEEEILLLRDTFGKICDSSGIRSKSDTTEKWEEAVTKLLHEHPGLYNRVCTSPEKVEDNRKALDIICRNIAKTERLGPKMTQTDAKNALGLNPEEAREAREILNNLLKQTGFANKLAATPTADNWEFLMELWGVQHDKIGKALNETDKDPDENKQKALFVLSRDVLKRLRDNRLSRQSKRRRFDMDTLHSNQAQVDDTNLYLYTGELETQSQQDSPSSFNETGPGDLSSINTFDNVPESPYTLQATSSPDPSTMSPYLPVQPSFGDQIFPLHSTHIVNPQPMFGFPGNSNMSLPEMSQYAPPLPGFPHASFTGVPYAAQSHGNASFHTITPKQWSAVDDTHGSDGTMTLGNGQGHFEPHAWPPPNIAGTSPGAWQQRGLGTGVLVKEGK